MVYIFGDCELDDRLYTLRCSGEDCKLEPKVFEVLAYLILQRNRFVTREELLDKFWPSQVVGEATLTQCIAKARKAVHDDGGKQQVIKTQHGRGYRFVAEVTERNDESPVPLRQVGTSLPGVPADNRVVEAGPQNYPKEQKPSKLSLFLRQYGQLGNLALVGLSFFFGVIVAAWPLSPHPTFRAEDEHWEKRRMGQEATLVAENQRRFWLLSANSPEASAYCLRGWDYYYRFTREANGQAREMLERAIARDPQYAAAYVGLGWTYLLEWNLFWTEDSQSLDQAFALAQKALTLDGSSPRAHALLGGVYVRQNQHEQAIAEGEMAVALDATCAECYATLADILISAGRARRAIDLVETARYLDPSSTAYYAAVAGRAYYSLGQPDLAIYALRRALIRNPDFLPARLNLVVAYSELGLTKAARAQLTEGQQLNPRLSLVNVRERFPYRNPGTVTRFLHALHKAGLGEK
jgi:DNA-binding winged helix-turn-helix (wHTH) protein/Tfp pilus assembly protein PilF